VQEVFGRLAKKASAAVGSPWAFIGAGTAIVLWVITGPVFKFSDTWQLVINTGTTIITFLMVFLIQNTQNRDSKALHLKLDEIIRSIDNARNEMIDLEDVTDGELESLENAFRKLKEESGLDDDLFSKAFAAIKRGRG
jgi:low affinity Fe/Cu permease